MDKEFAKDNKDNIFDAIDANQGNETADMMFDENIEESLGNDVGNVVEEVENMVITSTSSYRYMFYIILLLIVGLLIIWILVSMFTTTPPIAVLNQMLNNTLEIASVGDRGDY